jgi:hypothetical protein
MAGSRMKVKAGAEAQENVVNAGDMKFSNFSMRLKQPAAAFSASGSDSAGGRFNFRCRQQGRTRRRPGVSAICGRRKKKRWIGINRAQGSHSILTVRKNGS